MTGVVGPGMCGGCGLMVGTGGWGCSGVLFCGSRRPDYALGWSAQKCALLYVLGLVSAIVVVGCVPT